MKNYFKEHIPQPMWRAMSDTYYALNRAVQWPGASFHPLRRASIKKLSAYKDKHRGKRGFIIGNGPSLKVTDLSKLEGEFTFGMNRIYLLFPELGFSTTYFLSVNSLVIEQCAQDIVMLPMQKFLSWRSHHLVPASESVIYLHTTYTGPKFATDARGRLWEGATVTYAALQLAYFMGFEEIILVGVDHSFSAQGKPNETVLSQGDDRDHFDRRYFGKGFRWQLPDLDTSERSYLLARRTFEEDDRQVLDATLGGKLQVFPKVDYSSLF